MLKSVRLKNFKLHEDTSIEGAPITVFIGPNNSGKSSVFQALLCLRQAAILNRRELFLSRDRQQASGEPAERILADVGDFEDVVRQGQNEIQFRISGTVCPRTPQKHGGPLEVESTVSVRNNKLAHHSGSVESPYGKLSWQRAPGASPSVNKPAMRIDINNVIMNFSEVDTFRFIGVSGYAPGNAPPEVFADSQEFAEFIANSPSQLLDSMHLIPSLRGFEQSGFPLPKERANSVERLTLADRTSALASILAYNRDLEDELSQRLDELLHIRIKVKLLPGPRVTIWAVPSAKDDRDRLFVNEGSGANQLPFILIPISLTPSHETILLSEPEAHLHPKAQSGLTSLLLKVAKKENIQFFIETHSEHVLHKLLHSIGKGELTKEELALYYFVNEDGRAKVTRLGINDLGQVDGGLPGFFEQSLTELTEYLDALRKP